MSSETLIKKAILKTSKSRSFPKNAKPYLPKLFYLYFNLLTLRLYLYLEIN